MKSPKKLWGSFTLLIATEEGILRSIRIPRKHFRTLLWGATGGFVLFLAFFARWLYIENRFMQTAELRSLEKEIEKVQLQLQSGQKKANELDLRLKDLEEKLQTKPKKSFAPLPEAGELSDAEKLADAVQEWVSSWQVLEERLASVSELLKMREQQLEYIPSLHPLPNGKITSGFGMRKNPNGKGREFHRGIDIKAPAHSAVLASASGKVLYAGWKGGYGRVVIITHLNGFKTVYAHNSSILISAGMEVKKGQKIALTGSTGDSTGPHLHYEVWYQGKALNPKMFLSLTPLDVARIQAMIGGEINVEKGEI